MEESVSGFKLTGTWTQIVEHGERISHALTECGIDTENEEFQDWEVWRPKVGERLSEDVNEKTAEKAAVSEGRGEKAGKSPDDDLTDAGNELNTSLQKLKSGQAKASARRWWISASLLARATDTIFRKLVRQTETTIYKYVMTSLGPYYFDNTLVQANVSCEGMPFAGEGTTYTFEVNISDDDLRAAVRDELYTYEEEVDRWHLDMDADTEQFENAEGVDLPDDQQDRSPPRP